MAQSDLKKRKAHLKSEGESLDASLSEARCKEAKLEKDLVLAGGVLKALKESIDKHESQIKSQEETIKQKQNEIDGAQKALEAILLEAESASDNLAERESKINAHKHKLEEKEAQNIKAEASIDIMATTIHEKEERYKSQIEGLEQTLKHLQSKKDSEKESLKTLEDKSKNLESSIETQRDLISSLRNTYTEASRSGNLKEVFKTHGLAELVKITEDKQKILSIKDSKDRVHQFIIPKEFHTLAHSYFHKIVESLDKVVDADDLPHEYALEVTKYIRGQRPQYNCLT